MEISDNILRELLRNCHFINGTAYAGKSTMVRLLAQRHDGIECGENYHDVLMLANSRSRYAEFAQSGFFTFLRTEESTEEEELAALETYFML